MYFNFSINYIEIQVSYSKNTRVFQKQDCRGIKISGQAWHTVQVLHNLNLANWLKHFQSKSPKTEFRLENEQWHCHFTHRALLCLNSPMSLRLPATGGWPRRWGDLTCGVEAEQQGAGDGEGQDPHGGNHHKNPLLGAMAGVVHDGHHDGHVPAHTLTLAAEWRETH